MNDVTFEEFCSNLKKAMIKNRRNEQKREKRYAEYLSDIYQQHNKKNRHNNENARLWGNRSMEC